MRVCLLLCCITSDSATRYVSLIQIWKTEYTRRQLPGPPEEPVSPGQDQTEIDGNVTGSGLAYAYIGFVFITAQRRLNDDSEAETLHQKKGFLLQTERYLHLIR